MEKRIYEALKHFNDFKLPQGLSDTETDEYDFIADNTFFGGIASQALDNKDVTKFSPITGFIDAEYRIAKECFLQKKTHAPNYQDFVDYFDAYEKAVEAMDEYLKTY